MTTIIEQKILNGILEDDKSIQRQVAVAGAVATLNAQVDLMMELSAYLFTEAADPASPITADYITDVTARFQAELVKLSAIMPKLAEIEALGNAENGVTNLADMIAANALTPETFADRYK